jgi:hypothetical protein
MRRPLMDHQAYPLAIRHLLCARRLSAKSGRGFCASQQGPHSSLLNLQAVLFPIVSASNFLQTRRSAEREPERSACTGSEYRFDSQPARTNRRTQSIN